MCQAVHAAVDWCMAYPEFALAWHDWSNYLVILSVSDEEALQAWASKLNRLSLRTWGVNEPDLGNALTAVAVEHDAWRHVSSLPLAGKEPLLA